jgi:eukaryotic-like serine/threonine-protein kinase
MDVRTWTTVSRLLDDALDLPASARPAWIDTLGPEHEALKPRLRELLAQAEGLDREVFLATLPKFDAVPDDVPDDTPSRVGALVGPYRLVRPIASGGQGAVWLAERADGLLARPVAVKLPHGLAFRPGLAERMAREREILATLTHPNIARLYDAGVTTAGEPFLALEYVEGTAIDQHVAARGLTVAARVRLFLQVLRAVAFAHGRLVIHRDLKPSNVLVTPDGDVRLLDFGIAKLLDAAADSTLTVESGRAMTLAYASPEQIAQQPLGVATDVYSLGVLLFELLTGARPYAPARDSAAALEEAILTQEPRRASQAAPSPAAHRILRGDLDTILAKALRKVPAERYASVDAFGDDLSRWLDGLPVAARPASRAYRVRRFVGRHRVAVAATAASLAAVLAGAGAAVWQAQVARAEQRRAEEVKEFIASVLHDANPDGANARPMAVLDLLRRADQRLAAQPSGPVKAELLIVLGEGLLGLGDTQTLVGVAARAIDESARAGDPDLRLRAHVLQAQTMFYAGEPAAMLEAVERAEVLLAEVPVAAPVSRATLQRLRADAYIRAGRYAEGVSAARESLTLTERAGGSPRELLQALMIVADAEHQAKHPAEAVAAAERAHAIVETQFADNPGHPFALRTRALYADALVDKGELRQGVDLMVRVVADSEAVFGPGGRTVAYRLQRLAHMQMRLGRPEAAVVSARRALAIIEQHTGAGASAAAPFHNAVAMALVAARQGGQALPHVDRAIASATALFGPTHDNTVNSRALRAEALWQAGRRLEAARDVRDTVAAMEAGGHTLWRPLLVAGLVAGGSGDTARAVTYLDRAAAATAGDTSGQWRVLAARGRIELQAGQTAAAAASFERAVAVIRDLGLDDPPDAVDAYAGLSRARQAMGRQAPAIAAR